MRHAGAFSLGAKLLRFSPLYLESRCVRPHGKAASAEPNPARLSLSLYASFLALIILFVQSPKSRTGRFLSRCRNAGNERIWCCPAASCYPRVLYCLLLFRIFPRSAKSRGHPPTPRGSCAFAVDLRRAPATASNPRRRDEDFRTGSCLRDQGLLFVRTDDGKRKISQLRHIRRPRLLPPPSRCTSKTS